MQLPAPITHPWFEAKFFANVGNDGSYRIRFESGDRFSFAQSQGLFLWCPCGFGLLDKDGKERFPLDLSQNLGRPHGLLIPFSNPPCGILVHPDFGPRSRDGKTHPRWAISGSELDDLTLVPSIAVGNPECWHGFITAGIVKN
jgi:hypothetical protein